VTAGTAVGIVMAAAAAFFVFTRRRRRRARAHHPSKEPLLAHVAGDGAGDGADGEGEEGGDGMLLRTQRAAASGHSAAAMWRSELPAMPTQRGAGVRTLPSASGHSSASERSLPSAQRIDSFSSSLDREVRDYTPTAL
jgi:hypothetical protein